jgi:hypothetical protein
MDTIFPLKSKKSIKAINQAVSNKNAMMRLQIQNALYQQELKRVKDAAALAQKQADEAAAALAQKQADEAAAQKKAQEVAQANANKQELIANLHNKKSSKFGKLLSKMNKQH